MQQHASAVALLPLVFFLLLFFGAGLYFSLSGDDMGFYRLHAPVAILPAIALALLLGRQAARRQVDVLLEGMGHSSIMLMCLIFLLAGAFASVTRQIGGVDAAVYLGMQFLPPSLLLPGLFVVAGLVSLAMGTSMGTIAAVVPIAMGLAEATGFSLPLTIGTVIGGAMFGDNLSVISDTTIASTQTQGAHMHDKFRENVWIALPAAMITLLLLSVFTSSHDAAALEPAPALLALPYLIVLVLALAGLDVLAVLVTGMVCAGLLGIVMQPGYSLITFAADIWKGFQGMFQIMLLSILVGGLAALMRDQGGLTWLTRVIKRMGGKRAGHRTGETGIGLLGALTDVFVANNTVAILITGSVAKDLAQHHDVSPARSASLLDIFSCVIQGLLPYGAQILLAASIASLSPLALVGHVHYCWVLAAVTVLALITGWPRRRCKARHQTAADTAEPADHDAPAA